MPVRWTLPDDHGAAAVARRHVASTLAHLANVGDIELVASELTTNAIRHGGPPVHLALEPIDGHVRITVSSASGSGEPRPQHAADDEDHGRGLAIVAMLAADWGWSRDGERLNVWADFRPQIS